MSSHQSGGFGRELARWQPRVVSQDAGFLPDQKTINARSRDLVRNYGYAQSGIQIHIDNIVGASYKLSCKVDYKLLGITPDQADEWAQTVERKFNAWAESIDCYIDAEEKRTFTMLVREAIYTHTVDGEITAAPVWREGTRSSYATRIKMVDPARICTPNGVGDTDLLRAGVELGPDGEALAYHVRKRLDSDARFTGADTLTWVRIPKRTEWGRKQFIHIFDPRGADQTRGVNTLVTILKNAKQLEKYQDTHLANAIVNAMYAAVVESSMNNDDVMSAIGAINSSNAEEWQQSDLAIWTAFANRYGEASNILFDGVTIPRLLPNEKLNINRGAAPQDFAPFEQAVIRHLAAGFNLSYEQLSRDFTKTNFSSARAALQETWRYFMGRRKIIADRFATEIYALWLEEAMAKGDVPSIAGAPSFWEAKDAWTRCHWIATGPSQIDGLKETKTLALQLSLGLITFEEACAQLGRDSQDTLVQLSREIREFQRQGLTHPIFAESASKDGTPDPETDSPEVNTNDQTA